MADQGIPEAQIDRILRGIILDRAEDRHCYWMLEVPGVAFALRQHLLPEIVERYEAEQRDKAEEEAWFDDETPTEEEGADGE